MIKYIGWILIRSINDKNKLLLIAFVIKHMYTFQV